MIHGSEPNVTRDRFRRSFICHYVPRSTESVSAWYSELLAFNGEVVPCRVDDEGGPCGTEEMEIMRAGVLAQGELARVGLEQGAISLPN